MSIQQGLCSYDGRLFAAWKNEGDDDQFFSQFNGATWSPLGSHRGKTSLDLLLQ